MEIFWGIHPIIHRSFLRLPKPQFNNQSALAVSLPVNVALLPLYTKNAKIDAIPIN
jgi:hypothetical protein